jgi:hypothetical protein
MRTAAIRSIFLAAAAVAIMAPASAAFASSAAPSQPSHTMASAKAVSVTPRVPTNCPPGYFCSYNSTNGSSPCFKQPTSTTYYNWAGTCADKDQSLNNNIAHPGYPGLTRVYHNTFESGAWMCMNAGNYIDDVSKGHDGPYRFDQGQGLAGYNASIKQNIQSSEIDAFSTCVTNN